MKITSSPAFLSSLIIIVVAVLTGMLFSHSALLSGSINSLHIDSQVYIHAAKQILQGKILYKEVFDHKGPFLYVFECVGVFFCNHNYVALWIWQWIIFALGVGPLFIFWAKTYNPYLSILSLLLMIAWIFRTKTIGDNLPEIYAISIIAFNYYCGLKIIEAKHGRGLFPILLGITTMALFLVKANLVVVLLPSFLWLFVSFSKMGTLLPKQSEIITLLKNVCTGCLITLLPFVIYFAYHHALSDALFAFWTFNFSYISSQKLSLLESISQVFLKAPNYLLVFIVLATIVQMILAKDTRGLLKILLFSLLLSIIILVGIPGRGAESFHYAIPMAPMLAWIIMCIGRNFLRFQLLILFAISLHFFKPVLLHVLSDKARIIVESRAVQYINKHKKPPETLCILGNRSAVYAQTQLQSNTPFFYTYPIMANCMSSINEKFAQHFAEKKADWILHEIRYPFDSCVTKILDDYTQVYSSNEEQLYRLK